MRIVTAIKMSSGYSELSAIFTRGSSITSIFSVNVAHWHHDDAIRAGSGTDEGTAMQLPAVFRGNDDSRRVAGGRDVRQHL